jgi:hypothetical protein
MCRRLFHQRGKRPRGSIAAPRPPNVIRKIFHKRFQAFESAYKEHSAFGLFQRSSRPRNINSIRGTHLVRRYGICSSRTRGTWKKRPALYKRAAECWYGRGENTVAAVKETEEEVTVSKKKSREAWVRLLAKVYEINVLCCPHCGGRMSVTAVIRDPESIGEIIFYMENKGRGPPQARNSIRPLIDSVQ